MDIFVYEFSKEIRNNGMISSVSWVTVAANSQIRDARK